MALSAKQQRQIDQEITRSLQAVCEQAEVTIGGFAWLTHLVDYGDFPHSLQVVCVFVDAEQQAIAKENGEQAQLVQLIRLSLSGITEELDKHITHTAQLCRFANNAQGAEKRYL